MREWRTRRMKVKCRTDPDDFVKELEAKGAKVSEVRRHGDAKAYSVYVIDPSGNRSSCRLRRGSSRRLRTTKRADLLPFPGSARERASQRLCLLSQTASNRSPT